MRILGVLENRIITGFVHQVALSNTEDRTISPRRCCGMGGPRRGAWEAPEAMFPAILSGRFSVCLCLSLFSSYPWPGVHYQRATHYTSQKAMRQCGGPLHSVTSSPPYFNDSTFTNRSGEIINVII